MYMHFYGETIKTLAPLTMPYCSDFANDCHFQHRIQLQLWSSFKIIPFELSTIFHSLRVFNM